MRRLGQALGLLGLALGGLLGIAILVPVHLTGLSWLIEVGLAKLTFVSSLGLIAGGAVLRRIANRAAAREQLPPPSSS